MELAIFDTVYALGRDSSGVSISSIPEPLRDDFRHFMVGRTFVKRNGEMVAFSSDFRAWLRKLSNVGVEVFSG